MLSYSERIPLADIGAEFDSATLMDRYKRLSPSLQGVMHIKSLLGTFCKSLLLEALTAAKVPPPKGRVWSGTALQTVENTLRGLELTDRQGVCALALQHGLACRTVSIFLPVAEALIPLCRAKQSPSVWFAGLALQLRLAVYMNNVTLWRTVMGEAEARLQDLHHHPFAGQFVNTDYESSWFASRHLVMRQQLFANKVHLLLWEGRHPPALSVTLAHVDSATLPGNSDVLLFNILCGRFAVAMAGLEVFDQVSDPTVPLLRGMIAFFQGQNKPALMLLREGLKRYRKLAGRRKAFLAGPEGLCLLLALLQNHDVADYPEIRAGLDEISSMGSAYSIPFVAVEALFELAQGHEKTANARLAQVRELPLLNPLARFVALLADVFIEPETSINVRRAGERRHKLETAYAACHGVLPLIARMYADILNFFGGNSPKDPVEAAFSLVWNPLSLVKQCEPWEHTLDQLVGLLETSQSNGRDKKTKRLIWLYDHANSTLEPVEQTIRANGEWTVGRVVSLRRLCEHGNDFSWLTMQDRSVLTTARRIPWGGGYVLDSGATFSALVGHPLVFSARDRTPVSFEEGQIELCLHQIEKGYSLMFSHPVLGRETVIEVAPPADGKGDVSSVVYKVGRVSPLMNQLALLLGPAGLHVPTEAADRMSALLTLLQGQKTNLPLRTDLAAVDVPCVSSCPVVQLRPIKGKMGFAVQAVVRPFAAMATQNDRKDQGILSPPLTWAEQCLPAGTGNAELLVGVEGVLYRAKRDLPGEQLQVRRLLEQCPTLQAVVQSLAEVLPDSDGVAFEGCEEPWMVDDLSNALAVLEELHQCATAVEWPEGEQVRLTAPMTAAAFTVRVRQSQDWFQVQGTVQVSEDLVLDMGRVLERLEPGQGRFVPLGEGLFVTLTKDFRRQLDTLKALTEAPERGKGQEGGARAVHPLGVEAVQTVLEQVGHVVVDEAWGQRLNRVREASSIVPKVPVTLDADLREYQREGFVWMARLAHWGAGACLADDMGLGKTVQTIAMLLYETERAQALDPAEAGPCLVVAPTSVCHNWEVELARFAPSLRVSRLSAGKRRAAVEGLGAGDVLIVSYGLLHGESALLASRRWQMAVFDEAQALKNATTKRARAGRRIDAVFRMVLTGTPIENDLEDLWSLFNTINPGLLGSHDVFQKRFAGPIMQGQDAAREAMKALVKPFILRRTKEAVLTELPPRTEQTLLVDLPDNERAMYEALRRNALKNISEQAENPGIHAGQRKLHILAELTRLRRACCHPSLVDPHTLLPGAKLEAFMELVREMVRGGHKVLVFSQFVGHLTLARQALERAAFSCHYLDGSTPERERRRLVAAFQDGEKDLFLISLRAGGQGLNLTAADCVIHLDPWWNPAVEDQASDRAYRMGQTRPVSVYRLIVSHSVEEKIVRLHTAKRDLAADFLEGADVGGSLSEEELLDLLQQTDIDPA